MIASEEEVAAAEARAGSMEVGRGPEPEGAAKEIEVTDWSGYPEGVARPPVTNFNTISGLRYAWNRAVANAVNNMLHKVFPQLKGLHVHEITPIKFGGSPSKLSNKVALPPGVHYQLSTFWRIQQRMASID